jgi:hypothetical protein
MLYFGFHLRGNLTVTIKRELEVASHIAQPLQLMGMNRLGELTILIEDLEELEHYGGMSDRTIASKVYQFVRDQQAMEGGEA